jgi:type IV secretory pathway VirB3-like protein
MGGDSLVIFTTNKNINCFTFIKIIATIMITVIVIIIKKHGYLSLCIDWAMGRTVRCANPKEARVFSVFQVVQTRSGAHQTSRLMGAGVLSQM